MSRLLANRTVRPFLLLALAVIGIGIFGGQKVFTYSTGYSVFQQFATLGPVALALGLTMLVRHFDISVAGVVGLAGCVAVIMGAENPLLGLGAAIVVGAISGLIQGTIIVRLNLSSIGVTLGGLLTLIGIAYVVTGNQELSYPRLDIASFIDNRVLGPISLRSLVALVMFAVAGVLISWTRAGRDLRATGSDPKAAMVAGVSVGTMVVVVFVFSGILSAIAGALLSYSLATASPVALSNMLVPAAAAAIIGGVSLGGGRGHPLGIAGGVLVLCVLQSGLTAIGVPPYVHDVVTGGVLLIVGIFDGVDLQRRIDGIKRIFGMGPFGGPSPTP